MKSIEQQFFNDLEKKLWAAADKLRSNLDAAVYKHVVLGLIFLKYVSDAFEERQRELREQFTSPDHDYTMNPDEYGGAGTPEYEDNIAAELEIRDYYTEKNVFWVPVEARWQTLRDCAQLPPKAPLPWNKSGKDEPEEMRSVGWLIDNAMEAVERENARLKNVLEGQQGLEQLLLVAAGQRVGAGRRAPIGAMAGGTAGRPAARLQRVGLGMGSTQRSQHADSEAGEHHPLHRVDLLD